MGRSSSRKLALGWPGRLVVVASVGWAFLPRARESAWEDLVEHARLVGHLLGWLPRSRPIRYGQRTPVEPTAASNGTIQEVQGWVDAATFLEQYAWKGPVVFRGAATKANGFNIECLNAAGDPGETMRRELADRKLRIFKDQYDDASADWHTVQEYEDMVRNWEAGGSKTEPYARAFPLSNMETCSNAVNQDMLEDYQYWTAMKLMPGDKTQAFYSRIQGTNTKMHMDLGNSFFTQVYGRKRWLFVDPKYASQLQIYADTLNLVYVAGFDLHREQVPPEIPVQEVILHPGDVLYFPSMCFHAVMNLDPVTLGVDYLLIDPAAGFVRHWLLSVATLLNPWVAYKVVAQVLRDGYFDGHALYFDGFSKTAMDQAATER